MANESYSVYPDMFDGYTTLPLVRNLIDEIRAEDVNRLRDAIIKIEYELGINPSGTYSTVSARLDSIGDVGAEIASHLVDTVDAHDASAISILDTNNHFLADNVEDVLEELILVTVAPNAVGYNDTKISNSGFPSFTDGYGTKFVYNTSSASSNTLVKTQPDQSTGVQGFFILEISPNTPNGSGTLSYNQPSTSLQWQAPGDSAGLTVNISAMVEGDEVVLQSSNTSYGIRLVRNNVALSLISVSENFDIYSLDAKSGTISLSSTPTFKDSDLITRTAISSTSTSRKQLVISGIVYPADKGTLVLQRMRRNDPGFFPIATLDLSTLFDTSLRKTKQLTYIPTFTNYDAFVLYDRYPMTNDYLNLADLNVDGELPYENYAGTNYGSQLARYLVPISNNQVAGGELLAATDISENEARTSAYRVVHYKEGVISFIGEPAANDVYSYLDGLGALSDANSSVRFSNLYVDSSTTRPTVENLHFAPSSMTPSVNRYVSGVNYYNSSADVMEIEFCSDNSLFSNSYLRNEILKFSTNVLNFPSGTLAGDYGAQVDVEELAKDGYGATLPLTQPNWNANKISASNLPNHFDQAFYVVSSTINSSRRPHPAPNMFSAEARISATLYDPFGAGNEFHSYGYYSEIDHVLVDSYSASRATNSVEYFTDESKRVGTTEIFDFKLYKEQFTDAYGPNLDGNTLDAWNSVSTLSFGELQCGARFAHPDVCGLIFPQNNYSLSCAPTNTVNYSNVLYEVDSIYQRLFNLGHTFSGASLRISSAGSSLVSFDDIKESNASRPIKIEVKIPGTGNNSTGWLDIGKFFETGKYVDGDGALYGDVIGSAGDFTVPFTFGYRNNGDTGNMAAVRVTYFGAQAATAKLKVITLLELLS